MEPQDLLEQLGRSIMGVRDFTLGQFLDLLKGRMQAPDDQELQHSIQTLPPETHRIMQEIGRWAIDNAMSNFLWHLEGKNLALVLRLPTGGYVDLSEMSDGLSGDYSDWTHRFSRYPPYG